MTTLANNINKELVRLDKLSSKLRVQYNKETNYGDNQTTKGSQLLVDIYNIGDLKAILNDTLNKIDSFNY